MITDTTPSSAGGDGPLPASSAAAAAAAAVACPSLLDALAAPRAYDTPQEAGATRRSLLRKQPVRRARSGAGAPQRWRPDRPRRRSCCAVTLRVKRVARRATARPGKELQPRAIRPSGAATHRSTAARRPRLIGSPRTGDVGQLRLLAILTILRAVVYVTGRATSAVVSLLTSSEVDLILCLGNSSAERASNTQAQHLVCLAYGFTILLSCYRDVCVELRKPCEGCTRPLEDAYRSRHVLRW